MNDIRYLLEYIQKETNIDLLKRNISGFVNKFSYNHENIIRRLMFFELINRSVDLSKEFPLCQTPVVSIVIPVKNEVHLTNIALNTILQHTVGIDYEVIIADDNSTDETTDIENRFKNVRRIINDSGVSGFVYNVTNAVKYAKGKYIFLMNNDMIVTQGYLKYLLDILEKNPSIGIAGSKNLNVDSTVQETGVNIDSQGLVSFINKGLPENIDDEKEYIECDYCSGCSILFKKDSWDLVSGFDPKYAPAYYEDSDFALSLKYYFGLKSVCVPRSKIYHFKGCSYEKVGQYDSSSNREYFLSKWASYLSEPKF